MTIKIIEVDWSDYIIVGKISDLLNCAFKKVNFEYFSPDFLRWKHADNPFGESYSYIAMINNEVVGLRCFLRWQLREGGLTKYAVRPVDTCTSPAHQGKGIFGKLTKYALSHLPQDTIIFNTPNKNSYPGYIKMGWSLNEKLNFRIIPRGLRTNKVIFYKETISYIPQTKSIYDSNSSLITAENVNYFNWRYSSSLLGYSIFSYTEKNKKMCILARVNDRYGLKELVICDIRTNGCFSAKEIDFILQNLTAQLNCHYSILKDFDGVCDVGFRIPFKHMKLVSTGDHDFMFKLSDIEIF